jgi:predicted DNA-binding antitoxin AbrB/MazE fold protein
MKTIHAIYEHGVFRPQERVELPERCEVEFEPRAVASHAQQNGNLEAAYAIRPER